jgi:DNA-binding LacI/PurR family transcriptional regulator
VTPRPASKPGKKAGKRPRQRRAPAPSGGPLTIRDVAVMAAVSPGTVSKVLNDAPGVGPQTRGRVLDLVRQLDYHPDASARSLVVRRTGSIGVIIPHTGSYSMASAYWPVLLTAITDRAAERDMNVLLSTARSEEDVDSAYRSILRGRRVDGLVVGAEQFGQTQLTELLVKGFPFVVVGKSPFVSHWHVDVDNTGGACLATKHLASLGRRRIAMLAGPEEYPSVRERVEGYREAMQAVGLEPRVEHCAYHDASAVRSAAAAVERLLDERPEVDALFVGAGDLATPALAGAARRGIAIPSDLAVVVFDDHPYYDRFSPALTAVSQPIHDLGEAAFDMLFALMSGQPPEARERILPTRLVVRASCGASR